MNYEGRESKMAEARAANRYVELKADVVDLYAASADSVPEAGAGEPGSCDAPVLTRRELQVAALIARGLSNQQIASALVIEQGTVANHVAHILRKLDVSNRTQIAAWFLARRPQPNV